MDKDARHATAVYQAIADELRRAIATGKYKPGQSLPTKPVLAVEFRVGEDCIRNALKVLANEGAIILGGPSVPARVSPSRERAVVVPPPGSLITIRMPTPEERRELEIEPRVGVPVFVIHQPGETDALYAADRIQIRAADQPTRST